MTYFIETLRQMSPSSFEFKLTVPNDPAGATVVSIVATHAVEYASVDAAAGVAFVERAREAALRAMKVDGGTTCVVVFAAADGQLTLTIGS